MSVRSSATAAARRGNLDESIFSSGATPAPRFDPTAALQQMQQNRMQTMQNLRSPLVRRDMSGAVVDETAPQGLDTLRSIPHSWDQTYNNTGHGGYGNVLGHGVNATVAPQELFHGAHGNALVTPYGAGYSPFQGQTMGTTPAPTYGADSAMTAAEGKRVTQAGLPQMQNNMTAAYNDTVLSPFQSLHDRAIANPAMRPEYDSGQGVDPSSIFQQPPAAAPAAPAAPPMQSIPPDNGTYNIPPVVADTVNTLHDSSGIIPNAARSVVGWGADLGDSLVNSLWNSHHGNAFHDAVSPFVNNAQQEAPPVQSHPALYSNAARQSRQKERQRYTSNEDQMRNFVPSGDGTGFTAENQQDQQDRQFWMEQMLHKLFPEMLPAYR